MDKSDTLLLDVGNLLFNRHKDNESDVYKEKNQVITHAMNLMKYDALNLSPNDIFPVTDFLEERCGKAEFAIISANIKIDGVCEKNSIKKYIIKEINGIRIGITGVMPKIENNFLLDKRFFIKDPKTALDEIIPDLAAKTDYIILLSGFKAKDTLDLLTEIPAIDLGLTCESSRLPPPVKPEDKAGEAKSPSIMNITIKGMELGILNIEKDKNQVYITDANIISLDQKAKSDEKMLEVSKQYEKWQAERSKKINAEIEKKMKKESDKIDHEKLLKGLELSPQEYFNQNNQSNNANTKSDAKKEE